MANNKAVPRLRATLIAFDNSGRVLLLKHIRPGKAYWVLPGGGVDPGERLEFALEREIKEELGVNCRIDKLVAVGELITLNRHVVDFFFLGSIDIYDGFNIRHEEGIGEAVWVDASDLKKMSVLPNEIHSVLEKVFSGCIGTPIYLGKYKNI